MAQITTGFRAIFSAPRIYDLAQDLVGAERSRAILVHDYLRPQPQQRILDIGCGTARILPHLPVTIDYTGVDLSQPYIDAAQRAYASRGHFYCVDIGLADPSTFGNFDLALAIGLLHHLDDDEARNMLAVAHNALKPGGRLVTIDGCFDERQSALARFTIGKDRGRNVRTTDGYANLARSIFDDVSTHVRFDMIRIPYTHAILECRR
ncbi:MAG: class I SAM-dependent methyltransferase [Dokdonella sp.]